MRGKELRTLLTGSLAQSKQDIVTSTLLQVVNKIKENEVTPSQVLQASLEQKANTKHLCAYIPHPNESHESQFYEDQSRILDQRAASDRGPLHGVPIAVKDNFCATYPAVPHDSKTTAGSKILSNFTAPYNATVVNRLVDQGAVVIGKTSLDEFGMGSTTSHCALSPPTINPWSLFSEEEQVSSLSSGGSSGGSAVAVASYSAFGALGSDTGGSVRQPAAWNGIVGFKPSYGTLSRFGLISYGSSLDCPGIFTRTAADSAFLLDIMSGPDSNDNNTVSRGLEKSRAIQAIQQYPQEKPLGQLGKDRPLRVGIPREYWVEELSAEMMEFWNRVADICEANGAELVECSLPHTRYALPVYLVIANAEASSNLARYDGVRYGYRTSSEATNMADMVNITRKEALGSEVQRRIIMGTFALSRDSYESFFLKSQLVRRLIKEDFDKVFEDVDLLLTPTAPTEAQRLDKASHPSDAISEYMNDLMTIPANLAGIPALSLPVGINRNGLPVGMQLMAKSGNDAQLLHAAHLLEDQFPEIRE